MNKPLRLMLALALVLGVALLAGEKLALARGAPREAYQADLASVNGLVWNDVDQDGVQDGGEGGLPDVSVNLYDNAGKPVNTAITDAKGRYQFADLTPGEYYMHFVPPAGYVLSPKDQGRNEARDSDADVTTGETVLTALVAGENNLKWDVGMYNPGLRFSKPEPGTVQPPRKRIRVCQDGDPSVGGVSTLHIRNLAPGYCLEAYLHNKNYALGRIPPGAGKILANVTFLQVYYRGKFTYEVPAEDGEIRICYALPPGKEAQIYFYNHYGPRFGQGSGQPAWEPVPTTVTNGIACAAAQTSGAYALIGQ
jgi:hypothetical protein